VRGYWREFDVRCCVIFGGWLASGVVAVAGLVDDEGKVLLFYFAMQKDF